ncbi:MAG: GntR family transcriptional regulator, partial [Alphaproteobacteria bacterium]
MKDRVKGGQRNGERGAGGTSLVALGFARGTGTPLHRQLYDQLREAILVGRLAPGARLPSTRGLAAELALSRNTVATAFEQLLSEGYVEGRVGAGTYVSNVLPEVRPDGAVAGTRPADAGLPALPSRRGEAIAAAIPVRPSRHAAFALAAAELDAVAAGEWGRAMARWWRHPSGELMRERDPSGWLPLRRAIAAYLGAVRAVRCTPEQVMIVSGAQAGLDLSARLLLDPGETAWIEEPGYAGLH